MMITREELVEFDYGAFSDWAGKYGPPAGTYRQWWRITPKKYRHDLIGYAACLRSVPARIRERLAMHPGPMSLWLRWRLARDPDFLVRGAVSRAWAAWGHAWAAWGHIMPWELAKVLLSDPLAYVRYNALLAQDTLPGAWVDKLMRDPDPATRRYAARFTPTNERRKRV
jgi:hypothetical protein